MDAAYIAVSIPFFFILIGVEAWVSKRQRAERYQFADSIADLSCGISQQVTSVFMHAAVVGGYIVVYETLRIAAWPATAWWTWVLGIVLVDHSYYWSHRAGHRVNFLWAAHVVHHQSEEYNLAVALRQSALQGVSAVPFYLPLAVLGLPPSVFVTAKTIDTIYQFWIHTRAVGKLGPFEWVMNTPSHHRVHHGIEPKYIDKNYAGIFIVWDRLFGSFIEETTEPTYGTVKPLESWDWAWANVAEWAHIAKMARDTSRFRDKLLVWVMPPEWRPADLGGTVTIPDITRDTQVKHVTRVPRAIRRYVVASFVPIAVATVVIILAKDLGWPKTSALVAFVLVTLSTWAALFDEKPWAIPVELARLAAMVALAVWIALPTAFTVHALVASSIVAVVSGTVIVRVRGRERPRADRTDRRSEARPSP